MFLVDLTPIDDPELLLPAIATATGIHPTDNGGLAGALSDGPRLLVLDNFEQLTDAAPRLATLMAAAAPLKVLATSQVPLRIAGETIMRLEPLSVADDDSPAVALFVERARHADPSFDLDTHRDDVLRLVDVLDGVPLAIELAAARVNVLTPGEVLDRLGSGILATKRSDSPERHRSLTAAVEWSYDLLTPDQQQLLQALSVFRGGASLAAIDRVVGRDPLDDLGELVDRSLVETGTGIVGKRFDMLTTVQLYAASRIPDDTPYLNRHTDHFASLASDAYRPLDSDASAQWVARLSDDIDNLRVTLETLLESGDIDRGFDMLGSIWRFFQLAGRFDELAIWLDRFFTADAGRQPTVAKAKALMARAALHYWRSEWVEAGRDYDDALTIVEEAGEADLIRDALLGALTTRSNAVGRLGLDIDDGAAIRAKVQELADGGDHIAGAYLHFNSLASNAGQAVDPTPPEPEDLQVQIDLFAGVGRMMNVGHMSAAQAELCIAKGEYADAIRYALSGLDAAQGAGDVFGMSWNLYRLSIALIESGQAVVGTRIGAAADAARDRSGGRLPAPFVPIEGPQERSVRVLGVDASKRLWAEGREIGIIPAADMAREAANAG